MGCSYEAACFDCKVRTKSLGYGSGSTWLTACTTVKDFFLKPVHIQNLLKNQRWLRFLEKHEGHNIEVWSDDYTTESGGVVVFDDYPIESLDLRGFYVDIT